MGSESRASSRGQCTTALAEKLAAYGRYRELSSCLSAASFSADDVQARRPTTQVSLSRVGVTGVEKVVRIRSNGSEQLFYAELECFVDLGPQQKGAHMSRFEEVVNEAIDEVVLGEAFKAETLASHIAERVRDRQDARRAEVTIAARYPRAQAGAGVGRPHAGDLHAVRLRRGVRARHAPADRRARPRA